MYTLVKLVFKILNVLLLHIFLHQLIYKMADNQFEEFSYWREFIFKAVIGQYNLRTIFLYSHWRKQHMDIQRERKRVD